MRRSEEVAPELRAAAVARLNELLATGQLAFEGPVTYSGLTGEPPYLVISRGMLDLGLIQLHAGVFNDTVNEYLAQEGGPYALGETISQGRVSGIASIVWRKGFMTDSVLLRGSGGMFPATPSGLASAYLRTVDELQVDHVLHWLSQATGEAFEVAPLLAYLTDTEFALESQQVSLQQRAALFLLVCMFLALYTQISAGWERRRDIFRIERMLGRSRNYFLRHWWFQSVTSWLWGLTLAAVIVLMLRAPGNSSALSSVIIWWLSFMLLGSAIAFTFVFQATRFSLARTSVATHRDWRSTLGPTLISFGFVLGVTLLSASLFTVWRAAEHELAELGADQLLAITTPAATAGFSEGQCSDLSGVNTCAAYGYTNIDLWTPELDLQGSISGIGRFQPGDAEALRLTLTEGRYPRPGVREVAVNEAFLPEIRSSYPEFGIGQELALGYHVVGIVRTPLSQATSLFDSLYEAHLFIHANAPEADFKDDYFLAPWGESALMLSVPVNTDVSGVKQEIWAENSNVEFIRPASFTLVFARTLGQSLIRLAAIFALTLIAVAVIYHYYITLEFLQRRFELAIWRVLGMNLSRVRWRLWGSLSAAPLLAGLFASLIGAAIIWRGHAADGLQALLTGFSLTLLLVLLSLVLTQLQMNLLASKDPSQVYREAR